MNITRILRAISRIILPKDESESDFDKFPPYIDKFSKIFIQEVYKEPDIDIKSTESAYYIITNIIRCKKCGYEVCIPIGDIPNELYRGCNGEKTCFHEFEKVINKKITKRKGFWFELPAELYFEELIKTENANEGIFFFYDSWWKTKSGKYVYTAHLKEIIHTD